MSLRPILTAAVLLLGLNAAAASTDPFYGVRPGWGEPSHDVGTQTAFAPTRQIVSYATNEAPGSVVVNARERALYFVLGDGKAVRYRVGVGRPGMEWSGSHTVSRKAEWPDWTPPPAMLKRRPDLPRFMKGGIDNPLGARAMYLGGSLYRIHGSNEPDSIGHAVSSGCIRMMNEDVVDLYERVRVGSRVVVLR
jgi:lipoprotein-anchoring transpeptidase ErfK/SrfK